MSDIEEKVSSLLSSPEAVQQLMSVVKSLAGDGSPSDESAPAAEPDLESSPSAGERETPSSPLDILSAFSGGSNSSALGGLDPKTMAMIMRLLGAYTSGDDHKVRLLSSLKPYIREEKQMKIDKAMQIVKLARVAKIALNSFGGGEESV